MKSVRRRVVHERDLRIERRGLTLLEMLLAASILAMSLAVLARQNGVGVRAALRSQLETEAAVLCQSQLNRLLAEKLRWKRSPSGRWRMLVQVSSLDVVSSGGAILSA
jgi:prepilin-type N-terminal cleavage/methylation domain-containing protein